MHPGLPPTAAFPAPTSQRKRFVLAWVAVAYTVVVAGAAVVSGLSSPSVPRSNIRYSNGTYHVHAVAPDDLLDVAGVRAGDEIVALNGAPFPTIFTFWDRLRALPVGDTAKLTVRRSGATLELSARTWRHARPVEVARVIAPVAVLILLGAAVFAVRPTLPGTLLLLLFCLASAVNDVVQLAPLAGSSAAQRLLTFAYCFTSLVSPALLLHLFLVFPHRGVLQRRFRPALPFAYALQLGLGLDYWLPSVAPATASILSRPEVHQTLTGLFGLSVVGCFALGAISLVQVAATAPDNRVRDQAKLLAIGLGLLGLLQLTLWELPLRLAGRALVDPATWCLADLVLPAFIAVAVVSRRLFDINLLIRHGLVFGSATGAAVGAFMVVVALAAWVTETIWSQVHAAVVAVAAAGAAFLYQPALRAARELVDRTLYHRRHGYRQVLAETGARLSSVVDLSTAAVLLHARVAEVLQPTSLEVAFARPSGTELDLYDAQGMVSSTWREEIFRAFAEAVGGHRQPFVPAPGSWPDRHPPVLVTPFVRGPALLGAMLLGPRPDAVPYLPEDRDFVATLANLVGPVVEVARLMEERALRERLALVGSAASSMVHELKNPLGAMRSTLAVLRRRLRDDPLGQELTQIVENEVDRLKDRVLNVLTFVRPSSRRVEPVAMEELLRQLAAVVEPELGSFGVEVQLDLTPDTVVLGDADRLGQVFLNLLLNAREAMPDGGRVEVSLVPAAAPEAGVVLTVEDTGPGFSAESLGRAFEPFFTTKTLGTGLGLANVRRVVEEHGGQVEVGNRPEGGATVRVVLPETGANNGERPGGTPVDLRTQGGREGKLTADC